MLAENKILVCCRQNTCPTLEIVDNQVFITDDYGSCIEITEEQALMLTSAYKKVKKSISKNNEV